MGADWRSFVRVVFDTVLDFWVFTGDFVAKTF